MHSYRLSWKSGPPLGAIDASPLRADWICKLPIDEVRATRLVCGRRAHRLDDLCEITLLSDAPGERLFVEGAEGFHFLAAGQTAGVTTVHGPAGHSAGAGMLGGELHVHGFAAARLASGMRGGLVSVLRDAGELVGGPLAGESQGMLGGEILVFGAVGPCAGLAMRRGLIAVAGAAGASAGCGLRAGVIVVGRGKLTTPGTLMQRGSLIALEGASVPPHFTSQGRVQPLYWRVLARHLRRRGFPLADDAENWSFDGYSGDSLSLGRGELLCRA